ncbi:MAG: response regulator [Treponema sp.]|nr:response regulator [Treponema sp.]
MMEGLKTIIIVDDNSASLTACRQILKSLYRVFPVLSAAKMFELLERITPDLILLDVDMPEMDGYEAIRKLKAEERFKDIPVIFMSARIDPNSEMGGLNLGALDYIHKPFYSELLLRRLDIHLTMIASEAEAHKASAAKGEFISRMSHEIRTPLNAIIGMLSMAMDTEDLKRIKSCLERAKNASDHLLGILNDILDMSKIEADKFELLSGDFNLEKMLMNIIQVVNIRSEAKKQSLVVKLEKDVPLSVCGDELRLSQVITNLLTNAVKFTPELGKVIISVFKIEEIDDDITLRIEVADSGIGISEDQKARLFTSYGQADSSISHKFGGTGLGLVISKRIVELMGGSIWVESEQGKGSKFIFTIVLQKGSEKSSYEFSLKINREDIKILAVDDSDEMTAYYSHIMESLNLPCDVASSGKEALEMIERSGNLPYNVFFVDLKMPEMDGITLTRRIKEIAGDDAMIILVSADDLSTIENEAISAGIKHFIPKPVFPSMIINALNKCMGLDTDSIFIEQKKKKAVDEYDFSGLTILAAEDNEINREILEAILEKTNVKIDFAEDGKIAVSMFKENPGKYKLILMDVQMPEMDGFMATKAIRAMESAKQIPIVAMTANVFREDIEKCIAAGMNDHLGKPIDADILFSTMAKYIFG